MFLFLSLIVMSSATDINEPDRQIIGGTDALPGQWTHLGLLWNTITRKHVCHCSLIFNWLDASDTQYVLTMAHCIADGTVGSDYKVDFGWHDRSDVSQFDVYDVSTIQIHPYWQDNSFIGYPHDLALLTLTEDVVLNDYISAVIWPTGNDTDYTSLECWTAGWGTTSVPDPGEDIEYPYILQHAEVSVIQQQECKNVWNEYSEILSSHICTLHTPDNTAGACIGDSGAPVVCDDDGTWYLVGMTSWIRSTCEIDFPTVNTRISAYALWIRCVIGEGGTDDDATCAVNCPCGVEYCPAC